MDDRIREGIGCLLQGLAFAIAVIGIGVADALLDGRLP